MREISTTLKAGQQAGALNPLYKIVLTGASSYTYGNERILPSEHDEEMYSHRAKIVLSNHDHALDSLNLKGYDAVISYGVVTKAGQEYSATAPLSVINQLFSSDPNKLTCTLELEGAFNLMADDEASENYIPEDTDTKTVKELVNAIVGATLAPFSTCVAYEVVWDEGYDALADSYRPRDGFRIYTTGSRLAALRRVLDFTANVPRFGNDSKCHIMQPVTEGSDYDSEYSLAAGFHTFNRKAYKESLVFPGKIYVKSFDSDDPQYLGVAQVDGYDSLPDKVKKVHYVQAKLESNDQADDIAEALIKKAEMGCAMGDAEIRINVASEVFDYVKVTDSRQGDTRTGNIGYIHRRFGPDKWVATFGFGNWTEMLRYRAMLKDLETYTDAGSYFPRLQVGSLYATLDEIQDGPDVYVRQRSLQLDATGVYLADNTLYTIRVPGGPQHNLHKSATAPTGPEIGDFWIDTNYTPNMVKMWDGDSWDELTAAEVAEFNRGMIFRELKSVALTADGLVILDQVQVGTYGKIKTAALSASGLVLLDQTVDGTYGKILFSDIQAGHVTGGAIVQSAGYRLASDTEKATWNSKIKTFYQTNPPTSGMSAGDLWFDTNDKNKVYRYGTSWVEVRDTDIAQALADAASAYDTAIQAYDLGTDVQADIVAGYLTLSQYTAINGLWYNKKGVLLSANFGIRLYGGQVAFSTHPTLADAQNNTNIQCYIGTDGCLYAGAGNVKLNAGGITILGQTLTFYRGATYCGYVYGSTGGGMIVWAANDTLQLISSAKGITMAANLNYGVDMVGCNFLTLPQKSSDPTAPDGTIYYRTSDGKFRAKYGGVWYYISLTS